MAIQGNITLRGFSLPNAYLKIRLSGVNERVDIVNQLPVTFHVQSYTYEVKFDSLTSPLCVEGENFDLDTSDGHYSQAYNDLATKLNISNQEV